MKEELKVFKHTRTVTKGRADAFKLHCKAIKPLKLRNWIHSVANSLFASFKEKQGMYGKMFKRIRFSMLGNGGVRCSRRCAGTRIEQCDMQLS